MTGARGSSLALLAALLLWSGRAPAASLDAEPLGERLSQRLGGLAEGGRFSGELLVARRGQTIRAETFGGVAPGAFYRIGSVTKGFTAAAILRLCEQGKLKPEDPVAKLFPGLPGGRLGHENQEVTVDHLLTHTSGLGLSLPDRKVSTSEIVEALRNARFFARPGTTYRYSNEGFVVLGEIVRRVSGTSYEAFLHKEVFARVGLRTSGIVASEEQRLRFAPGQVRTVVGLAPAHELFPEKLTDYLSWDGSSDGGIFSTVSELTRWLDVLAAGQFLSEESRARLFDPRLEHYARGFISQFVANPGGPGARRLIWHNGSLPRDAYQAFVGLLPEDGVTVVVLANVDDSAVSLTPVVFAALLGQPAPEPRDAGRLFWASARVLNLGPLLAVLPFAALMLFARQRRPFSRVLMLVSVAVFGAGLALVLAPVRSHLFGLALALAAAIWFLLRWREPGPTSAGESLVAVFAAAAVVFILGVTVWARLTLGL